MAADAAGPSERRRIYLDYAASTPLCAEARAAMLPWLDGHAANAGSAHQPGQSAQAQIARAASQLATAVHAEPDEIIWTSGATESNNLAIFGAAEFAGEGHIITSRIEHKATLAPIARLEQRGWRVTRLEPSAAGHVEPQQVADALRPDTRLVSLMWVNNETGAVTDIAQIAALCERHGAVLHVDAAQALCWQELDWRELPVQLMSVSAHKCYGPQGIGALLVRKKPAARLQPQLFGGGQQRGLRAGTMPVALIAGFGAAVEAASAQRAVQHTRVSVLAERLIRALRDALGEDVVINGRAGDGEQRAHSQHSPHIVSASFRGVNGESLLARLPNLAVATGSACTSASAQPSYVLRAMGLSDSLAEASLRLSLGWNTTADEIDAAAEQICNAVKRLQAVAPP